MKYNILVIFILSCFLFSKEKSVTVTGISTSQNMNKAVIEAQNNAKREAIEEVVGVKIKSSTLIKNYQTVSDFVLAESIGEIKKTEILKWDVENIVNDPKKIPIIQLSVQMKIEVSIPKVKPDENYQLSANLEKNVLFVGDEITIKNLQVTKNSYLYLFSVNDNKIYPIIPNPLVEELYIKPADVLNFPSEDLKNRGLKLKAQKVTNEEIEYEQLMVLAMKNKSSILDNFLKNNKIIDVKKFSNILLKIPLNERILKIFDYEIRKKLN